MSSFLNITDGETVEDLRKLEGARKFVTTSEPELGARLTEVYKAVSFRSYTNQTVKHSHLVLSSLSTTMRFTAIVCALFVAAASAAPVAPNQNLQNTGNRPVAGTGNRPVAPNQNLQNTGNPPVAGTGYEGSSFVSGMHNTPPSGGRPFSPLRNTRPLPGQRPPKNTGPSSPDTNPSHYANPFTWGHGQQDPPPPYSRGSQSHGTTQNHRQN